MKLLYLFLSFSIFIAGCHAQTSALPKKITEDLSFSYYQGGAMNRSYRKFSIEGGVLTYEELKNYSEGKKNWSAKVETDEIAMLYEAFRTNAFDGIRNDKRNAIVHDAGSESIEITLGLANSYHVTYGPNSPLSGRNLERYRAVRKSLDALLARHQPSVDPANAGDRLTGTWRVEGDNGGHAWYLQWKFADGRFEQRGYPPLYQEGKYRIAAADGSKITLELFDQQGNFGEENRTVEVVISVTNGTMSIAGRSGFIRVND